MAGSDEISSVRSALNAALMLGVVVPPALAVATLRSGCGEAEHRGSLFGEACGMYMEQPVLFVNVLYAIVVDFGFWVIYLAQGSTWLIDPHWQIIPACIALFYASHPRAIVSWKPILMLALLFVWATRLMHNYLRREQWRFGVREDWRYADMRRQHGGLWWLISFFAVSVAQHPMLVGLTLPFAAAFLPPSAAPDSPPWVAAAVVDATGIGCCVAGIVIGYFADTQLFTYMEEAPKRRPVVLETGLWRYSRHPNHFGEQLWWVGLALLGASSAHFAWWPLLGVLYNHPLDTLVTLQLIEDRMLARPERRDAYKAYQGRTSLLLPWPPRPDSSAAACSPVGAAAAPAAAPLLR